MNSASKGTNIIEINDIKKILLFIADSWLIILISIVLSLGTAYFYSYKLPKIHAAKARVLLKPQETYSYQEGLFKNLGIYSSYERMANEQRILTSTDLIAETIDKLKLDVSYYIVGKIRTKQVFAGTPFEVEAQIYSHLFYELPFTFKILNEKSFELSYTEQGGTLVVTKGKFGEPIINNNFYLLIKNTGAINETTANLFKAITYQFVVHHKGTLLSIYSSAIKVQNLEWSNILEITMEHESPELAVEFLDSLCAAYIRNSLKTRIRINENTINYIDKQLGQVVTVLDSIENMLESFKESKSILNLSKEENTYYENLTKYEIQKRNLELQQKSMAYLKEYITSNLNRELRPPSVYIDDNDPYLKKAVSDLYNYQVQINNYLFTGTEKTTTVKELEYKIELLRNDMLKYIAGSEKAINEKMQTIDGEIAYYEALLKGVPRNQRQMLNINRKLQVNEKMYVYLLEKRAETVIAKAGIVSDISIIETAYPIGVVKPNLSKIYYSFVSGGILVAILISFLKLLFFRKIKNINELRELTQFPVVGEIYHAKDTMNNYLVIDKYPRSFITESFRILRTNIEYLGAIGSGNLGKVILVTSNRPSVGKTFCSVNLAAILAKSNKRVIMLEMDLHKPKLQDAFRISSEVGISSALIGKVAPQESISKTSVENLDVILSGPTPPNASELILSKYFNTILDYAKANYDYVIIDTPPMGIISDALALIKYSDINLYVLSTKSASYESLQYAHNVVENNKSINFSFVLNNVKPKFSAYYYKSYNYAYGHNGSETTKKEKTQRIV